MKNTKLFLQILLFLGLVALFTAIPLLLPRFPSRTTLTVAFLDVGQGDAIYIETPNRVQVLIDGGKGAQVLRELGKVMPWYDRSIDLVVATHPDQDHIGGLIDVLEHYDVGKILQPDLPSTNTLPTYFQEQIVREGSMVLPVVVSEKIILDERYNIYLEILHPSQGDLDPKDKNESSVVLKLVYDETSFLFTGDVGVNTEKKLIERYGNTLDIDVLKVGHHGSRSSTSQEFLKVATPNLAIISAGCDNRYGHPHTEVTNRIEVFNIPLRDTCSSGTIRTQSDGKLITIK